MKAILGLLVVYILIDLGLIAVGVGIGSLLHWMVPSIDLGTGILIAVVATGFSIHYFIRLLWFSEYLELPRYEDDDSAADPGLPARLAPVGAEAEAEVREAAGPPRQDLSRVRIDRTERLGVLHPAGRSTVRRQGYIDLLRRIQRPQLERLVPYRYYLTRPKDEYRKMLGDDLPPGEIYLSFDPPRMFKVIRSTRKPCLDFKVLAAGRRVGSPSEVRWCFEAAFSYIKPTDAVDRGVVPAVRRPGGRGRCSHPHRVLGGADRRIQAFPPVRVVTGFRDPCIRCRDAIAFLRISVSSSGLLG